MLPEHELAKSARAANHIRGLAPVIGSTPGAEDRAEIIRDEKMLEIERLIVATRRARNVPCAQEMEQRLKRLRLECGAAFWYHRRMLSALALLARYKSV